MAGRLVARRLNRGAHAEVRLVAVAMALGKADATIATVVAFE
jgi:hypothetical protein